jgi:polar amino acid transport system permease protein
VQFKVLEIFTVAALYYLVLTTLWGFVQQRLEKHFSRFVDQPRQAGGTAPLAPTLQNAILSHDAT